MLNIAKQFIKEEKGQTLVEWIMILALILIVCIVAVRTLGTKANSKATQIGNAL